MKNNEQSSSILQSIKKIFKIKKNPVIIRSNTTLTFEQLIESLINGLVIDCTYGDISITTPTAAEIITSMDLLKYDYFNISIIVLGKSLIYSATIIPGNGVVYGTIENPNLIIPEQNSIYTTWICYNKDTPSIILYY